MSRHTVAINFEKKKIRRDFDMFLKKLKNSKCKPNSNELSN